MRTQTSDTTDMITYEMFTVVNDKHVIQRTGGTFLPVDPYNNQPIDHVYGTYYETLDAARERCITENYRFGVKFTLNVHRMTISVPQGALFIVSENSDQTEGRGPMRDVATFSNFPAALAVARGRGVMGVGDCDVKITTQENVFSTPEEFYVAQKDKYSTRRGNSEKIYSGYRGGYTKYFTIGEIVS